MVFKRLPYDMNRTNVNNDDIGSVLFFCGAEFAVWIRILADVGRVSHNMMDGLDGMVPLSIHPFRWHAACPHMWTFF